MGKFKDLTGRGRGKAKLDKEVVTARGDIRIVPYKQWEFTILRDPTGPTAQRAKRNNDPDLNNIKVDTIGVGEFLEAPVIDVQEKKYLPKTTPRRDLRPTSRSTEKARQQGFIPAEEGKGFKYSGPPKNKEEDKE